MLNSTEAAWPDTYAHTHITSLLHEGSVRDRSSRRKRLSAHHIAAWHVARAYIGALRRRHVCGYGTLSIRALL